MCCKTGKERMNDIMGLFEHLKFVGNMKIENALQKAEDPNQVFNYSYTKQLEQLQQLRQGLVTIVQNEKHIEMLEAQVEAQMNRLQQQAAQAMQQGREDLARTTLQRKAEGDGRGAVPGGAGIGARERGRHRAF